MMRKEREGDLKPGLDDVEWVGGEECDHPANPTSQGMHKWGHLNLGLAAPFNTSHPQRNQ